MAKRKSKKKKLLNHPKLKKAKKTAKKILPWFLFSFTAVLLFIVIAGFGIYVLEWNNKFIKSVSKTIPYPIAMVDTTNGISFYDYNKTTQTIKNYHDLQAMIWEMENYDLAKEEGVKYFQVTKKNALEKMVKDKIIEVYLKKNRIRVTKNDIENEISRLSQANGGKDKSLYKIKNVYKMEIDEFVDYVVTPKIRRDKLYNFLKTNNEIEENENLNDWLNKESKKHKILIPSSQYFWNKKDSKIYFTNKELNEYEKSIRVN